MPRRPVAAATSLQEQLEEERTCPPNPKIWQNLCCPLHYGIRWEQVCWTGEGSVAKIDERSEADIISHISLHGSKTLEQSVCLNGDGGLCQKQLGHRISDEEAPHLGPVVGVTHGQGLSTTKPLVHLRGSFKQSPHHRFQILNLGKYHICLVHILKWLHSPNLCDGLGKGLMPNNLLSFNMIVMPNSGPRIRKQLRNLL